MTVVEITVVKYGMSMAEATLVSWLVEVGMQVEQGQPVAEIATDKVEMAIEAPDSGVLVEKFVDVNEDFPVPGAIGRIRRES